MRAFALALLTLLTGPVPAVAAPQQWLIEYTSFC
jgi:hypothetical protein